MGTSNKLPLTTQQWVPQTNLPLKPQPKTGTSNKLPLNTNKNGYLEHIALKHTTKTGTSDKLPLNPQQQQVPQTNCLQNNSKNRCLKQSAFKTTTKTSTSNKLPLKPQQKTGVPQTKIRRPTLPSLSLSPPDRASWISTRIWAASATNPRPPTEIRRTDSRLANLGPSMRNSTSINNK